MNLSLNSTLDEVFHTLWEAIDLSSMNCSVFAHYFSARDNIVYAQEFWLNAINLNGENRSLLANEYNILQSNSNWLEFDKWNVQFKSTENLDRLNATISSGRCAKTICKTLEWRGSADITGIGVSRRIKTIAHLPSLTLCLVPTVIGSSVLLCPRSSHNILHNVQHVLQTIQESLGEPLVIFAPQSNSHFQRYGPFSLLQYLYRHVVYLFQLC